MRDKVLSLSVITMSFVKDYLSQRSKKTLPPSIGSIMSLIEEIWRKPEESDLLVEKLLDELANWKLRCVKSIFFPERINWDNDMVATCQSFIDELYNKINLYTELLSVPALPNYKLKSDNLENFTPINLADMYVALLLDVATALNSTPLTLAAIHAKTDANTVIATMRTLITELNIKFFS